MIEPVTGVQPHPARSGCPRNAWLTISTWACAIAAPLGPARCPPSVSRSETDRPPGGSRPASMIARYSSRSASATARTYSSGRSVVLVETELDGADAGMNASSTSTCSSAVMSSRCLVATVHVRRTSRSCAHHHVAPTSGPNPRSTSSGTRRSTRETCRPRAATTAPVAAAPPGHHPVEALDDVLEEAELALLAVGHDVDPSLGLPTDDVGHCLASRAHDRAASRPPARGRLIASSSS